MTDVSTSYDGVFGAVTRSGFTALIRRRDPSAMNAVVRRYMSQVFRAARGAGLDADAAQDVMQSTFGTFIAGAPRFEGRSHVRTWLFGILYRKIAAVRRRFRRQQRVDDIDDVREDRLRATGSWTRPAPLADAGVDGAEVRDQIDECLSAVPEQQRAAFVLREVEQRSPEEVADALGVTPNNLGVLVHRARMRLRACLMEKGISAGGAR